MGVALAEVAESQAEGKVKNVYDDIKRTLRVPYVDTVFRALAAYPDYLLTAWGLLKPNVQTIYFEREADALREMAQEGVGAIARARIEDPTFAPLIRALHFSSPRLYLTAAALRSATNGEQPRMRNLSTEERQQATTADGTGVTEVVLSDASTTDDATSNLLADIIRTSGLQAPTTEYRALAATPHHLATAWAILEPAVSHPDYARLQRSLRLRGEQAMTAFPFRMDVNPHVLRHAGLSERDIDGVRNVLSRAHREGPAILANVALLAAALEGSEKVTAARA